MWVLTDWSETKFIAAKGNMIWLTEKLTEAKQFSSEAEARTWHGNQTDKPRIPIKAVEI